MVTLSLLLTEPLAPQLYGLCSGIWPCETSLTTHWRVALRCRSSRMARSMSESRVSWSSQQASPVTTSGLSLLGNNIFRAGSFHSLLATMVWNSRVYSVTVTRHSTKEVRVMSWCPHLPWSLHTDTVVRAAISITTFCGGLRVLVFPLTSCQTCTAAPLRVFWLAASLFGMAVALSSTSNLFRKWRDQQSSSLEIYHWPYRTALTLLITCLQHCHLADVSVASNHRQPDWWKLFIFKPIRLINS